MKGAFQGVTTAAGPEGIRYLSVHRRRGGLQIRKASS